MLSEKKFQNTSRMLYGLYEQVFRNAVNKIVLT